MLAALITPHTGIAPAVAPARTELFLPYRLGKVSLLIQNECDQDAYLTDGIDEIRIGALQTRDGIIVDAGSNHWIYVDAAPTIGAIWIDASQMTNLIAAAETISTREEKEVRQNILRVEPRQIRDDER